MSLKRTLSDMESSVLCAGVVAVLAVTYLVLGSRDYAKLPTDTAYLRPAPKQKLPRNSGGLMPFKPHAHWTLRFRGPHDHIEIQQRVVESHLTPTGQIAIIEARLRSEMATRRAYLASPHGLALLAASNGNNLYFEPPLPLLQFPLRLGTISYWHGSLRIGRQRQPAAAAMRLTGPDPLSTPAGAFTAYRMDLLLQTGKGTKTRSQHTTMWLAPNIGVVREQQGTGDDSVLFELVRYHPA